MVTRVLLMEMAKDEMGTAAMLPLIQPKPTAWHQKLPEGLKSSLGVTMPWLSGDEFCSATERVGTGRGAGAGTHQHGPRMHGV
jgi:hypothetical protein